MRIVCISDTHALEQDIELPDGDVLIHAGDLTNVGSVHDVVRFDAWLGAFPHSQKFVIAGNHDFCFEPEALRDELICRGRNALRRAQTGLLPGQQASDLFTHCTYLCDSGVQYQGLKFWGSPWQPWFHDWAFNLRRGEEMAAVWRKIPEDTNVLITHGPPHGIFDLTAHEASVGCEELLLRVKALQSLRLHVFGHIHESYGKEVHDGKIFVNASICTLDYRPINKPIVIDL